MARATALMAGYAERTGLTSARPARRYLWTDAFALCNALELARLTGAASHRALALRLVEEVHRVLGRVRPDTAGGWLSGLDETEGEDHPTLGGLRIGKPLPERAAAEPLDPELEWERDGQYFHYLTKWMHALDQLARATREPRYNRWARELAAVAHAAFTFGPPGARRMRWKMSTDLKHALVPSMGQHDPLDGLITCVQLESTAAGLSSTREGPRLTEAIADYAGMLAGLTLHTADPLGLGGLLADACRVAQLARRGEFEGWSLLEGLLAIAQEGLREYVRHAEWRQPAERRLAFRELGLAIGLAALERLRTDVAADHEHGLGGAGLRVRLEELAPQTELGNALIAFWLEPAHQRSAAWARHRDIDEVMLATSLIPAGFLVLAPAG